MKTYYGLTAAGWALIVGFIFCLAFWKHVLIPAFEHVIVPAVLAVVS